MTRQRRVFTTAPELLPGQPEPVDAAGGGSAPGAGQGLVADGGADPQPRLVQPALEGGLADTGDLRGLLGGEPFDVTQHDGGAQRGRQAVQGLAQCPAQFAVLGLPGGLLLRGGGQFQFPRSDRDPGQPRARFSSARLASLTAIR